MIQTLLIDAPATATVVAMPLAPYYINDAKTDDTIRVYVEAMRGVEKRIFDVLLDAGSPIKPRLVALLVGWAITDWMPDGVF